MYPPQICGTRLINETDINIMVHGYKKQNKRKFYSHPPKKKKTLQIYQGQTVPSETRNPIVNVNLTLSLSLSGVNLLSQDHSFFASLLVLQNLVLEVYLSFVFSVLSLSLL